MYKILVPTFVLLFCSSCYSYNESLNQNYVVGKHYKITDTNEKILKTQLLAVNRDSVVISGYKSAFTIAKKDIVKVEIRKFSYEKTIGLPILIVGVLTGLAFYSIDSSNFLSK